MQYLKNKRGKKVNLGGLKRKFRAPHPHLEVKEIPIKITRQMFCLAKRRRFDDTSSQEREYGVLLRVNGWNANMFTCEVRL